MWPFGKSTQDRLREELGRYANLTSGVEATVKGDTATLSGTVPTDRAIAFVTDLAEGINGIKQVDTSGLRSLQPEATSSDTGVGTPSSDVGNQSTAIQTPHTESAVPEQTFSVDLAPGQDAPTSISPVASGGQVIGNFQTDSMIPQGTGEGPAASSRTASSAPPIPSSALAKAAYRAISSNVELKDDPIDVLQRGNTVVLRGAVDSQHEYNLARQLAMVPGVTDVDSDELKIVQNVKQMHSERDEQQDAVYTVKGGDTLTAIALRYYGNANEYMKIARANGIDDPDRIQVGQRLKIPGA